MHLNVSTVRRGLATLAATVVATTVVAAPALAGQGGVAAIPLNNEQETTGAMGGASGFFSYRLDGTEFCYVLEVRGLTAGVAAAHVHLAPRETAGPVKIPLAVPAGQTSFTASGCTAIDAALASDLAADPRSYYVNVHTPTYPGGEVRGQLK